MEVNYCLHTNCYATQRPGFEEDFKPMARVFGVLKDLGRNDPPYFFTVGDFRLLDDALCFAAEVNEGYPFVEASVVVL